MKRLISIVLIAVMLSTTVFSSVAEARNAADIIKVESAFSEEISDSVMDAVVSSLMGESIQTMFEQENPLQEAPRQEMPQQQTQQQEMPSWEAYLAPPQPETLIVIQGGSEDYTKPPSVKVDLQALLDACEDPTDSNGDGLPDAVKRVLGLDPEKADSIGDGLDDLFKLQHGLDPLKADSNGDGLSDYVKIVGKDGKLYPDRDTDGDGVPDVWDFDCDGDGVPNSLDMSPFSSTAVKDSFRFSITTNNKDSYFDFQIRPDNEGHLNLNGQTWNWPHDQHGLMQNTDGATENIKMTPMLELKRISGKGMPTQEEVEEYGIIVRDDGTVYVPLNTVVEGGSPVAFNGRMYFPQTNDPADTIEFDVRLIWMVEGKTEGVSDPATSELKRKHEYSHNTEGGGIAIGDLDGNGKPDMLLMAIDAPERENSFRYMIGWNIDPGTRQPEMYSNYFDVRGFGWDHQGGDAALYDINGDGKLEVIMMAIDHPGGSEKNHFRYKIGSNINEYGEFQDWSDTYYSDKLDYDSEGGGVAVRDLNGDGKPDLILMAVDRRDYANSLTFMIGWDLDANGEVTGGYTKFTTSNLLGYFAEGAGLDIVEINGVLSYVIGVIDASSGSGRKYTYLIGRNVDSAGRPQFFSQIYEAPDGLTNCAGGGVAVYDLNMNGKPDLAMLAIQKEQNSANKPKVIWGTDMNPEQVTWRGGYEIPIFLATPFTGTLKEAGVDIADLTGNGKPDVLAVVHKIKQNTGYLEYTIGRDLDADGTVRGWTPPRLWDWTYDANSEYSGSSVSGVRLYDVNGDDHLDVVVMGNTPGNTHKLWYRVGYSINAQGQPVSWGPIIETPQITVSGSLSGYLRGGGLAIGDIDKNGKPDVVLMELVKNSSGTDGQYSYRIGWNMDHATGAVEAWSDEVKLSSSLPDGNIIGGDVILDDFNGNGKPDLLVMLIDRSAGSFQYRVGWDLAEDGTVNMWTDPYSIEAGTSSSSDYYLGAGVALWDIDGSGSKDMLLLGAKKWGRNCLLEYKVAYNVASNHNIVLSKYYTPFRVTGFKAEEYTSSDAAVFYSSDKDRTTEAYIGLRYDFLDSEKPLLSANTYLEDEGIVVSNQMGSYKHADAGFLAINKDFIPEALDSLPDNEKLPIVIATEHKYADVNMDDFDCVNGYLPTFSLNTKNLEAATIKSIRMAWFDTGEDKIIEMEDYETIADEYDYNNDEADEVLKLLLVWNMGEARMTRIGSHKLVLEPTRDEYSDALFNFRTGAAGLKGLLTIRKYAGGMGLITSGALKGTGYVTKVKTVCKYTEVLKGARVAPGGIAQVQKTLGRHLRATEIGRLSKTAGFAKALRIAGFAAGFGLSLYSFWQIASSGGFTGTAIKLGAAYASMQFMYFLMLELICFLPGIGSILSALIILSDFITQWITGEGWSSRAIGWVMTKIAGEPGKPCVDIDLKTLESVFTVDDRNNNGMDVGDTISIRNKYESIVERNKNGTTVDVSSSYIIPEVWFEQLPEYYEESHELYKLETKYSGHHYYNWKKEIYRANASLKWIKAGVSIPVRITFKASYRIAMTDNNHIVNSDSRTQTLYYDVMPGSLAEFISWNAITANDPPAYDDDSEEEDTQRYTRTINFFGQNIVVDYSQEGLDLVKDKDGDGVPDDEDSSPLTYSSVLAGSKLAAAFEKNTSRYLETSPWMNNAASWTFAARIRPDAPLKEGIIYSEGSPDKLGSINLGENGSITVRMGKLQQNGQHLTRTYTTPENILEAGQWQLLLVRFQVTDPAAKMGQVIVEVDGERHTSQPIIFMQENSNTVIGALGMDTTHIRLAGFPANEFQGSLDEVYVWYNVAADTDYRHLLAHAGEFDLQAYWNFDEYRTEASGEMSVKELKSGVYSLFHNSRFVRSNDPVFAATHQNRAVKFNLKHLFYGQAGNKSLRITAAPAHGSLETRNLFQASPAYTEFTYTPQADYLGTDSFKFEITGNGHEYSPEATVNLEMYSFQVSGLELRNDETGEQGTAISAHVQESAVIQALISPSGAANTNVAWTVANPDLLECEPVHDFGGPNQTERNYAVLSSRGKDGETTVTATSEDGGFSAIVNVTVQSPRAVQMGQDNITLIAGDSRTFTRVAEPTPGSSENPNVFTRPADNPLDWESMDPEILIVDANGTITARRAGSTYLHAFAADDGGFKGAWDSCRVTVLPYTTGLELSKAATTLTAGLHEIITATVSPQDARDTSVLVESDNPDTATVETVGKDNNISSLKITAHKAGTATLTITTTDYAFSKTVTVMVTTTSAVTLNKASMNLVAGKSDTLTARINGIPTGNVTWFSTDPSVAVVNSAGQVTAVGVKADVGDGKTGTAYISAVGPDGATCLTPCEVTVTTCVDPTQGGMQLDGPQYIDMDFGENKVKNLTATMYLVTPMTLEEIGNISNTDIWSSDKPLRATARNINKEYITDPVTQLVTAVKYTGEVTAVGNGNVRITAIAPDNSCYADGRDITVRGYTTGLSLDRSELALVYGKNENLTATVTTVENPPVEPPHNAIWSSEDPSIAEVDENGMVTAQKVGTTRIVAHTPDRVDAYDKECTVTVSPYYTGITLNRSALELYVGQRETLEAQVLPAEDPAAAAVWTSENPTIAVVSDSGKVTAVRAGTTNIIAATPDGAFSRSCAVTVLTNPQLIYLNKYTLNLPVGDSYQLLATVLPQEAADKRVYWDSTQTEVVTVDARGMVTAIFAGTVMITVTTQDGGISSKCQVTVTGTGSVDSVALTRPEKPTLSGGVAAWTAVANENNGYRLQLYKNGAAQGDPVAVGHDAARGTLCEPVSLEITAKTLSYDLSAQMTEAGNYTVTVTAKGAGLYTDSDESDPSDPQQVLGRFNKPEKPALADYLATWTQAASDEVGYLVRLYKDNILQETADAAQGASSYDFRGSMGEAGSYTVTIMQKGYGLYTGSPESAHSDPQIVIKQLGKPIKPILTGAGSAHWTPVNNENNGYTVQLYRDGVAAGDAVAIAHGEALYYDFAGVMTGPGSYTVTVTAQGTGEYTDSPESDPSFAVIVTAPLAKPDKPLLADCIATWTAVDNENDGYLVRLYKNNEATGETGEVPHGGVLSYDFSDAMTGAGVYTVTVTAQGSGIYTDSPESDHSEAQEVGENIPAYISATTPAALHEAAANDGSLSDGTVTLTIANGTLAEDITTADVTAWNLPEGLVYEIARTDEITLTITISGQAAKHTQADSINNLVFKIAQAKVAGAAAELTGGQIGVSFNDPPACISSVQPLVLTESSANDGSLLPNVVQITIAYGTLADDAAGHVIATNLPEGLTYEAVRIPLTNTLAITINGKAADHSYGASINNLTFTIPQSKVASAESDLTTGNLAISFDSATPEAPTDPAVDDAGNTFGWTNAPGYDNVSDYEYSLNSGNDWSDCTANPQPVGNIACDAGVVQVRVKSDVNTGRPAGPALASDRAYTRNPEAPSAPNTPVLDDDADTFNWGWAWGWGSTWGVCYDNLADYEYSLDFGVTWAPCTGNPQYVGDNYYPERAVRVRVKADPATGRPTGEALIYNSAFTVNTDRPPAPTNPVADDPGNTFGWTNTPGYNNSSDYEYSLDGGATWSDCTANPQPVGDKYYPAQAVRVRVKAGANHPVGAALASEQAFYPSPVFPGAYPETSNIAATGFDLTVKMEEAGTAWYRAYGYGEQAPTAAELKSGGTPLDISAAYSGRLEIGQRLFDGPWGVAVDKEGHVYVADYKNRRIQKFDSDGKYLTQWGSYGSGEGEFLLPVGVAADGQGNVYVVDSEGHRVLKFDANGNYLAQLGSRGAYNGQFLLPFGIAIDSAGNIFVTERGVKRVQKFDSRWNFLTAWNSNLNAPGGIALDSDGNVYVVNENSGNAVKFDNNGNYLGQIGFDGQFNNPQGIAVDQDGNIYVADTGNNCIKKFDRSGNYLQEWGGGGSGNGQFSAPRGISVDSNGYVYVADYYNSRIQKFDHNGAYLTQWGSYGSKNNGYGQLQAPRGAAVDQDGSFYVADHDNRLIQKFDSSGKYLGSIGSRGSGNGQYEQPAWVTVSENGDIYVSDNGLCRIVIFDRLGTHISTFGAVGADYGNFGSVAGTAVDSEGYLYVADKGNHRIQKFGRYGGFVTAWGSQGSDDGQFSSPEGIAIDNEDDIYVVDSGNNRVQRFDSYGVITGTWGVPGSGDGQFDNPVGIAVDAGKNIYVADQGNQRIQVFNGNMEYLSQWGNPAGAPERFNQPFGLAIGGNGDIYATDSGNNRVHKFDYLKTDNITGLAAGQIYDIYIVGEDIRGNLQPQPVKRTVTLESGAYIYSTVPLELTEAAANDGSLFPNTVVISIVNGILADPLGKADVTAANLPAGLDYTVTRDSDTRLTITITGNAINHEEANNVSNLTFTIAQAKVGGAESNLTTANIRLVFNDPAQPTIENVVLNPVTHISGTAQQIQVTVITALVEDGKAVTASLVDEGGNALNPAVTSNGTIASNGAVLNLNVGEEVASGNYMVKVQVEGIAEASLTDYVITQLGQAAAIASTEPAALTEAAANDGSLASGVVMITIAHGVLADPLVKADVTAANLPAGLDYTVTRNSSAQLTITITGKAINHRAANIVSDLTFTINKDKVAGAQNNLTTDNIGITFRDPDVPVETSVKQGAGVTIIIHGWQPVSGEPSWTAALQNAIIQDGLGGAGRAGKITVAGTKGNLTATCDSWNFDLASSSNGEIVVRVDWSAVANHLASGVTAQEVAAAIAPKIYEGQNGQPALSELPLHLIGHSRGGAMVYEVARLLGERGIEVEQVTSLDPHPLTSSDAQGFIPTIDTPVKVYENILFADSYWQNISSPKGQYVNGAYNREWTNISGGYHNHLNTAYSSVANHLNIHLMYQGTVDLNTPTADGQATLGSAERSGWFNSYESSGEKTGFYYSSIGGGDRKSTDRPVDGGDMVIAGYHSNTYLGGAGSRQSLNWSNAVWPNIITLDILRDGQSIGTGSQTVTPGEVLELSYTYRDYDSGATITFYVDRDYNPYNDNNLATIATQNLAATGSFISQSTAEWNTTELSPTGKYYVYAKISDGSGTRYLYTAQALQEGEAAPPVMGGTVSISGDAKYGATLTADTTGIDYTPDTSDDQPSYQWKRSGVDILEATASTYELVQADIGETITVTVTADGVHATGSVISSATAMVEKADGPVAPIAPELVSKTHNSVTLKSNEAHEFRLDEEAWQDSSAFTGLLPETAYTFTARIKETETHKASAASDGLSVTTEATPAELDTTAPTVEDGSIGTSALTDRGVTLSWTKATDAVSPQGALRYLVYRSDSNNIDTVENTEANGTPLGIYEVDINTKEITGLSGSTTYYFNVIVMDEAENKTAYIMTEVTTAEPVTLESIAVTISPAKTTYYVGESLDLMGLVVTGTYNDSSTEELNITMDNISGFDSSEPEEDQVIIVTYGGKTATFTVDIVSNYIPSENADLSGLTLSAGTLSPVFSPTVTTYSASVGSSVSSINVTPAAADSKATVTVNGTAVASGTAKSINLSTGNNPVTIVVTAENGTAKTYTITVNRAAASSDDSDDTPSNPLPANTSTSVIASASIDKQTTTTPTGQTVETFTVKAEASAQIEAAKAEGKTSVQFTVDSSQTSATEINIPATVLESATDLNVSITTPNATLELPAALVNALAEAGRNLSLTVTRGGVSNPPSDSDVLGIPTIINTDIVGATQVTIPLSGIDVPTDPQERDAFLASLAVFTVHSDGEEQIINGDIIYDANGNPVGITFPVDKFSTFAIVKLSRKTVTLSIGSNTAGINGIPYNMDAGPLIDTYAGRTLVPIRFISEALGAKVEWLAASRQIRIKDGSKEIILTVDSKDVLINGVKIQIDCAPVIIPPGRTYLPLRFISETLGADVIYDDATKQIGIIKEYGIK